MLGACAELFRDEPPSAELMAAVAPFGGGMGSSGRICGTLSGALAVIGFTLGKTEPKGRDHKLMWKLSHKMVTRFDEICTPYGGTNCTDIARINWKNHVSVLNFYKNPESTRKNCVQVIRETSTFLYDLITEHFPKKD
ncbi:MAG TPA: C_GCAxxG_C_C family protein [Desulfobulbaceae bacterium]|nr:C_GCAxxG_C_C family protein [Desulfobulbaceae bacterium]